MVMKISFEHIFEDGIHKVKITGFRVLSKGKLPVEYTKYDKFPMCYTQKMYDCAEPSLFINDANGSELIKYRNFRAGTVISLEEKEWICKTMKAAGMRLCRINAAINKRRAEWEGKVEVVKF